MVMFKIERNSESFSVVNNNGTYTATKNGVLVFWSKDYEEVRSFVLGD